MLLPTHSSSNLQKSGKKASTPTGMFSKFVDLLVQPDGGYVGGITKLKQEMKKDNSQKQGGLGHAPVPQARARETLIPEVI